LGYINALASHPLSSLDEQVLNMQHHTTMAPPLKPVAVAVLAAIHLMAHGSDSAETPKPSLMAYANLSTVVVTGARSERTLEEVPAVIDVIEGEALDTAQVQDIRDLVRELPNVSVRRAPQRFGPAIGSTGRDGNSGFNIRGLEGNRVLLTVDGVRVPRSLSGGLFGNAAFGRDYYDMGLISRVEIQRGANSALYGSDGLGGMVAMTTAEPKDILKAGQTFGGRIGLRFDQENNGRGMGATLAGQASETVQWLGSIQTGKAEALKNQGSNDVLGRSRTTPNPQKDEELSLLGKVVITPNSTQKHRLTIEHIEKQSEVDSFSERNVLEIGWRTNSLTGRSSTEKQKIGWHGEYQLGRSWADEIQVNVSYQQSDANEYSLQNRTREAIVGSPFPPIGTTQNRIRDYTYQEKQWQAVIQAEKTRPFAGDWSQKLVYGVELTHTNLDNLVTGTLAPTGETFPLKRFPETHELTQSLFVQSEFASEQWSVIPALRFDAYRIDPKSSPLYKTPSSRLSDSALSPKLGIIFRPAEGMSVFGHLAAGFRAPSAHQVNSSFENLTGAGGPPYRTIPNPNLKPETSNTLELGARGERGLLQWEAVAFSGRYKDFISDDPVRIGGAGTVANPTINQFINRDRVTISGFELKGQLAVGKATAVKAAYGTTRGKDTQANQPLNSVNPAKWVLGVDHRTGPWKLGATATHVARKSADDIDFRVGTTNSPANQFATPAYTTLDLSAIYEIRPGLRLSAALRNVTDRKYWEWGNVRSIRATDPAIDAYTAPGRSLAIALTADF
jgi:hemoglobin/transferrin/lactoferrin receptor protein